MKGWLGVITTALQLVAEAYRRYRAEQARRSADAIARDPMGEWMRRHGPRDKPAASDPAKPDRDR